MGCCGINWLPLRISDLPIAHSTPHIHLKNLFSFFHISILDTASPWVPRCFTMSGDYLKITGCLTGKSGNQWPPRKEFDKFLQDKKQTVLFFLALAKLCSRPITDRDSHFQLGGKYSASCSFTTHPMSRHRRLIGWPRDRSSRLTLPSMATQCHGPRASGGWLL